MVHVAQGYRASTFVHIPNGFDLARFAPDGPARQALRNEWRALGHTVVMGMVGRFDPQKDHHLLLRSFAKLHAQHTNTQLVLVGRGLDAHNTVLVQWIDDLGLNLCVTLLGQRQDVPKVMGALDVHVLSSRYGEAFPNVLAEAMACGTPCLTTDVGDAASVVGATGWVVPPNDEAALGQGMLEALHEHQQHSADWQRRQVACRQRVTTEFDLNTMIDRYQQVWFDKSLGLNS
jgi:glycosyltransferase involved in cell wall biosynthesis